MSKKNIEAFRTAHQAFNKRDFNGVVKKMTGTFKYQDRATGGTFKGSEGFKQFMQGWVTAFSDAKVSSPKYTDAGDRVIAEFMARGTNDGPVGPMPPTGKTINVPFCEIITFNKKGQMVSGTVYYDQQTLLVQLGHVPAPPAA